METIDLNTITAEKQATPEIAEIYSELPAILKIPINTLTDANEKAVYMMGALGVLSGLLPNVKGLYDGSEVTPNLYTYVVGNYGVGKGGLRYARQLGYGVHKQKLKETIDAKENKGEGDPEPPQNLHYIPANNSKTGFFELLNTNGGAGTLFESEGDTLADAIRQDFGNFSDGLRKGFHNEPITYYRRANKEFVEIEAPQISVVLSSTFDQLKALIPSTENGLFSRFLFYCLPNDATFKNVFDNRKQSYKEIFQNALEDCTQIYNMLASETTPITFDLSETQKEDFNKFFSELKAKFNYDVGAELNGTINRLGLQFFKIAMILSVFRGFDSDKGVSRQLVCTDHDFDLTKKIIRILLTHTIEIYSRLPQPTTHDNDFEQKNEQVKKACELYNSGMSYGKIAVEIFGSETKKSTIYRWIQKVKKL